MKGSMMEVQGHLLNGVLVNYPKLKAKALTVEKTLLATFYKGSESELSWLCRLNSLCHNYSTLPLYCESHHGRICIEMGMAVCQ